MASSEFRHKQAKLGLLVALGFGTVGLLLLLFVAAIAIVAWIIIVVSLFTLVAELISLAKLRKERVG